MPRPDLVKEFVIALVVISLLTIVLAAIFSSPDEKPITMKDWGTNAPNDVVATAAAELAGTSASATYGPPYNDAADGQKVLGLPLQKWGGVRLQVSSQDLVLQPLRDALSVPVAAMKVWDSAPRPERRAGHRHVDAGQRPPDGDRRIADALPRCGLAASFVALAVRRPRGASDLVGHLRR